MNFIPRSILLTGCLLAGCGGCGNTPTTPEAFVSATLTADTGQVLLDNDAAFASKLALVEKAQHSVDIAYYIVDSDYSSSALAEALLRAAERGVRIRLLTDYSAAYSQLDWFSMLQRDSNGQLEVRFYNRPTRNMIMDAAYLTLGCGESPIPGADCSQAKFAEIERTFAAERIDGQAAQDLNISNLSVAGSGDFLAGLYARNAELVALAVQQGQGLDPTTLRSGAAASDPAQAEALKRLGKTWLRARYGGGVDSLKARVELAFARALYGEQIDPVFGALAAYMPLERADNAAARRDWDYQSEFLHHKLLWVDGRHLVIGGRNVQDSYHMHPGELTDKYVFNDTDLALTVASGGADLSAAFERLWQFRPMVASLDEVRAHAPNAALAGLAVLSQAEAACPSADAATPDANTQADCVASVFATSAPSLDQRLDDAREKLSANAARYRSDYQPSVHTAPLPVDANAGLLYLENLPFRDGQRGYGASDSEPDDWGKHIHSAWLTALEHTCQQASAEQPARVVIHNAYFLLPANLLGALGRMLAGDGDCGYVSIDVVTNSFATTDLNAVNLLAAWQLKALDEHRRAHANAPAAANFRYEEYQQQPGQQQLSLHSKVMLFGDTLFIGSANADVRSFIMDTNNGIALQNAPHLVSAWSDWLQAQREAGRIRDLTGNIGPDADQLMADSLAAMTALVSKYDRQQRVSPQQAAELEARARELFLAVYRESQAILRGDTSAAERFNSLLKVI
ncbi:phospholipase D-like domain-containing protein [Parahaliea mediterranea]|uniref:phospholipase D-like domain-containing protein n=1 Tax=Parahaliea mediterranea TaxID=651086 RepID=UPI000E2EB2C4|nr:phospholipase D-like domain-containing protein [Parahaliea mediterranea]